MSRIRGSECKCVFGSGLRSFAGKNRNRDTEGMRLKRGKYTWKEVEWREKEGEWPRELWRDSILVKSSNYNLTWPICTRHTTPQWQRQRVCPLLKTVPPLMTSMTAGVSMVIGVGAHARSKTGHPRHARQTLGG